MYILLNFLFYWYACWFMNNKDNIELNKKLQNKQGNC